jgi:hypothetical protein
MGCDMAVGRKPGGKSEKRRGKRRRWASVRHSHPPILALPPQLRTALGLKEPIDPHWFAAADRELARCRKRCEEGDLRAVWSAIDILATLYFPLWVAMPYIEWRTRNPEAFNQALGIKYRKGAHHARAQRREELRPLILFRIYYLHATENAPLDRGTFDKVGEELGISGGEAEKIFGEPESDGLRSILRNLQIS